MAAAPACHADYCSSRLSVILVMKIVECNLFFLVLHLRAQCFHASSVSAFGTLISKRNIEIYNTARSPLRDITTGEHEHRLQPLLSLDSLGVSSVKLVL